MDDSTHGPSCPLGRWVRACNEMRKHGQPAPAFLPSLECSCNGLPSKLDVLLEVTKDTRELGQEVAARAAAGARVVDLANVRHLMRLSILDTKLDVDLANLDALEAAADLLALPSSAIDEDRTSAARERLAAALERYRIASDAWLDGMIKARGGRHS